MGGFNILDIFKLYNTIRQLLAQLTPTPSLYTHMSVSVCVWVCAEGALFISAQEIKKALFAYIGA